MNPFTRRTAGVLFDFVGISDLRGVPSFLKGFVRGKFPKEKDNRVLMDWKGVFAKQYEWQKGACNILIFSAEGVLVHQTVVRRMDSAKKGAILRHVNALVMKGHETLPSRRADG